MLLRAGLAGVIGMLLVFVEVFIVMKLKGYYSIEIGGIAPFVAVWSMNFFLLFTMFTHLSLWYKSKETSNQTSYYD